MKNIRTADTAKALTSDSLNPIGKEVNRRPALVVEDLHKSREKHTEILAV